MIPVGAGLADIPVDTHVCLIVGDSSLVHQWWEYDGLQVCEVVRGHLFGYAPASIIVEVCGVTTSDDILIEPGIPIFQDVVAGHVRVLATG